MLFTYILLTYIIDHVESFTKIWTLAFKVITHYPLPSNDLIW
jgi:hypothetical protein